MFANPRKEKYVLCLASPCRLFPEARPTPNLLLFVTTKRLKHKRAIKEAAHEAPGSSLQPENVLHVMPENAPVSQGFKKMGDKERDGLIKLHEIAYYIALKGNPFTDFKSQIELEKVVHMKTKVSVASLFRLSQLTCLRKIIKKKIERTNFISILCDGSTDKSIKEQEVIYLIFVEHDTHKPCFSFLK